MRVISSVPRKPTQRQQTLPAKAVQKADDQGINKGKARGSRATQKKLTVKNSQGHQAATEASNLRAVLSSKKKKGGTKKTGGRPRAAK